MTQPVDFGQTISCTFDLDPMGAPVAGITALSQALIRRITTPRGRLLTDPNYGYDIQEALNDDLTQQQVGIIGANVDAEFLKDQRVLASHTTVTLQANGSLDVSSAIQSGLGPFSLVLNVSAVTVAIIQAQ